MIYRYTDGVPVNIRYQFGSNFNNARSEGKLRISMSRGIEHTLRFAPQLRIKTHSYKSWSEVMDKKGW